MNEYILQRLEKDEQPVYLHEIGDFLDQKYN